MAGQQPGETGSRSLWFNPPDDGEGGRRLLTRERVVAEAIFRGLQADLGPT
jgi:hypothetical protein